MFKIVNSTKSVQTFLLLFKLNFSRPQMRHIENFVEAVIACQGRKTIARLNNLLFDNVDQSAFTDFFTYSPWDDEQLRHNMLKTIVELTAPKSSQLSLFDSEPMFIIIDDSKTGKYKNSRGFEVADWHFNTSELKGYYYGMPFVTFHIIRGGLSFPVALRPYLRQKTVRSKNRKRRRQGKTSRIPFKSKYTIVRETLSQLATMIDSNIPVYVLFDSWYASAKLIKYCRNRRWHVICALKNNRKFRKSGAAQSDQLRQTARRIRKRDFTRTKVETSDDLSISYWVKTQRGFLNKFKDEVSIFISKMHYNDKRPNFFMCTDLSLSARQALSFYSKRWAVEVDHLYLKVHLGLADFRLRSYEGVRRYFDLTCLTLAFLYWRLAKKRGTDVRTISDVIAVHRQEQQENFVRKMLKQVIGCRSVNQACDIWMKAAA